MSCLPLTQTRIMAYSSKPPCPPEHHLNGNKVLYAKMAPSAKKQSTRHIPQVNALPVFMIRGGKFKIGCRCRSGSWTRPNSSTITT